MYYTELIMPKVHIFPPGHFRSPEYSVRDDQNYVIEYDHDGAPVEEGVLGVAPPGMAGRCPPEGNVMPPGCPPANKPPLGGEGGGEDEDDDGICIDDFLSQELEESDHEISL